MVVQRIVYGGAQPYSVFEHKLYEAVRLGARLANILRRLAEIVTQDSARGR